MLVFHLVLYHLLEIFRYRFEMAVTEVTLDGWFHSVFFIKSNDSKRVANYFTYTKYYDPSLCLCGCDSQTQLPTGDN